MHRRVHECLRLYLSRISANLVLGRACARCGLRPQTLETVHLSRLITEIEPLLGGYLSRHEIRETLKALRALQRDEERAPDDRTPMEGEPQVIEVARQEHIDTARKAALHLCREAGLGNVDAVKVATVVSELARNIRQYAGQGSVTLVPLERPRPGVRVIAADEGPGIPHLDDVEGGRWRSSTGMGLGLMGSRRLMSTFQIETAPGQGTRVTTEKYLL